MNDEERNAHYNFIIGIMRTNEYTDKYSGSDEAAKERVKIIDHVTNLRNNDVPFDHALFEKYKLPRIDYEILNPEEIYREQQPEKSPEQPPDIQEKTPEQLLVIQYNNDIKSVKNKFLNAKNILYFLLVLFKAPFLYMLYNSITNNNKKNTINNILVITGVGAILTAILIGILYFNKKLLNQFFIFSFISVIISMICILCIL